MIGDEHLDDESAPLPARIAVLGLCALFGLGFWAGIAVLVLRTAHVIR